MAGPCVVCLFGLAGHRTPGRLELGVLRRPSVQTSVQMSHNTHSLPWVESFRFTDWFLFLCMFFGYSFVRRLSTFSVSSFSARLRPKQHQPHCFWRFWSFFPCWQAIQAVGRIRIVNEFEDRLDCQELFVGMESMGEVDGWKVSSWE